MNQEDLQAKANFDNLLKGSISSSCPKQVEDLSPQFVENAHSLIHQFGDSSQILPSINLPLFSNNIRPISNAEVVRQGPLDISITESLTVVSLTSLPLISTVALTKNMFHYQPRHKPHPNRGHKRSQGSQPHRSIRQQEVVVLVEDGKVVYGKEKEQIVEKGKNKLIDSAEKEEKLVGKDLNVNMEQEIGVKGPSQDSKEKDVEEGEIIELEDKLDHNNHITSMAKVPNISTDYVYKEFVVDRKWKEVVIEGLAPGDKPDRVNIFNKNSQPDMKNVRIRAENMAISAQLKMFRERQMTERVNSQPSKQGNNRAKSPLAGFTFQTEELPLDRDHTMVEVPQNAESATFSQPKIGPSVPPGYGARV